MIHVIPNNDLKGHETASTCHCRPSVEVYNGELIVTHSAFDGREGSETEGVGLEGKGWDVIVKPYNR